MLTTYREVLERIKTGETKALFMMPNNLDTTTSSVLRKAIMENNSIPKMFEDIFTFVEKNGRTDGCPVFVVDFVEDSTHHPRIHNTTGPAID